MIDGFRNYFLFLVLVAHLSCSSPSKSNQEQEQALTQPPVYPTNTAMLNGKQLAQAYCQACHLFPQPSLLDKKTWAKGVLPNMALRLGIVPPDTNIYAGMSMLEAYMVQESGTFAKTLMISPTDWKKIVDYYVSEAPAEPLPQEPKPAVATSLKNFTVNIPAFNLGKVPLVTMVKFDTAHSLFYVGDRNRKFFRLDSRGQVLDSFAVNSPLADIDWRPDGSLRLLTLGNMDPSDEPMGQLLEVLPPIQLNSQVNPLLKELPRPVHYTSADLNKDGREDMVICGFGSHIGRVSWYEALENKTYKEHILKKLPGARRVIVRDMDHNGLEDMVVLMTQAKEGVFVFYNEGKGHFREEPVLNFPPVYGSSYIELVDFNHDGWLDILYTNGDNADYSYSLKKYHGVRIYLNDGKNQFSQAWFYPMYGASKAVARDFDGDGDVDIAAIAFFPDEVKKANEGFLYFENKGNIHFEASTFKASEKGRWLTLEAADFDHDGDTDIALGSFLMQWRNTSLATDVKEVQGLPSLIILNNTSLQPKPH